ncbi:MAG: adenine C2-methylase RlmN of 23S rRNA A2503 and tRNA A37 [Parvicella sp.]|jgi:adenine C2-methylase RlmN of 23S rRNA A2503 and tRNA A37
MSVSKKVLKAHEFETIEEYFEYVLLSKVNGQNKQVKSLISVMSDIQKLFFIKYLADQNKELERDLNLSYWTQLIIEAEL